MMSPKFPAPPQSRIISSKEPIGPLKRRKVIGSKPAISIEIQSLNATEQNFGATFSKPQNKFEKAEEAINQLILRMPGLSLDQTARQEVILTLDEMDCLSEDDDNAHSNSNAEQTDNLLRLASPRFGRGKVKLRKAEYNKYEGVTKEFLRYQREIDRHRIRRKNISRAIKAMVARKQEKDEFYKMSMAADMNEKTSVKTQQVRRIVIGFVNRLIHRCINTVSDRTVVAKSQQKQLEQVMRKSKKMIVNGWRQYRFRCFHSAIRRVVGSYRNQLEQQVQNEEKAFRIRTTYRRLQEDRATQQWIEEEVKLPRLIPRENPTISNFHGLQIHRDLALANFIRTDLNPFSSNMTAFFKLKSTLVAEEVPWHEKALVSHLCSDVLHRQIKPTEVTAATKALQSILECDDDQFFAKHSMPKSGGTINLRL